MWTNEERLAALHARASELEKERRAKRVRVLQTAGVCLCLAAVIALAALMPGLTASITPEAAADSMRASIFAGSRALGYIVIAVVAFLLGAAVTVFCFRLKKWRGGADKGENK